MSSDWPSSLAASGDGSEAGSVGSEGLSECDEGTRGGGESGGSLGSGGDGGGGGGGDGGGGGGGGGRRGLHPHAFGFFRSRLRLQPILHLFLGSHRMLCHWKRHTGSALAAMKPTSPAIVEQSLGGVPVQSSRPRLPVPGGRRLGYISLRVNDVCKLCHTNV